jgi:outer membrane lipoprotein LolB
LPRSFLPARLRAGLAAASAALLLAACAAPGSGTGQGGGAGRPTRPVDAQNFSLDGRIAVRYGEESLSGKFSWAHAPATDNLSLATPLGNQIAQIVRDAGGVVLTNSRQEQFRARDVESLTEAQLGWRLPLAGLVDWVYGRPGSAGAQAQRDAAGRLTQLREAGWVIDYSYADAGPRPQRLILSYPRAEKPLEIRLVVDIWG